MKMVEKDENEMKSTTDFYLACYLEIKLKKLCEIKKQPNSTNVLFLFNKKAHCCAFLFYCHQSLSLDF